MNRQEIIEFIQKNNVGADRGEGLIAAFEKFAKIVAEKTATEVNTRLTESYN